MVLDWKSGKRRDYSEQVRLYAAMVFACFPEVVNIQPIISYTDLKKEDQLKQISRDEHSLLKDWVNGRVATLKAEKIWSPNPSYGCRWCHYRKSNGGPCSW
jgi:hypothetical protein